MRNLSNIFEIRHIRRNENFIRYIQLYDITESDISEFYCTRWNSSHSFHLILYICSISGRRRSRSITVPCICNAFSFFSFVCIILQSRYSHYTTGQLLFHFVPHKMGHSTVPVFRLLPFHNYSVLESSQNENRRFLFLLSPTLATSTWTPLLHQPGRCTQFFYFSNIRSRGCTYGWTISLQSSSLSLSRRLVKKLMSSTWASLLLSCIGPVYSDIRGTQKGWAEASSWAPTTPLWACGATSCGGSCP